MDCCDGFYGATISGIGNNQPIPESFGWNMLLLPISGHREPVLEWIVILPVYSKNIFYRN